MVIRGGVMSHLEKKNNASGITPRELFFGGW